MIRPAALFAAALLISAVAALADSERRDHDDARRAREAAAALPLIKLLPNVEERFGGQVIGVDFEREDGVYVYEFKLLTPDGHRVEVILDAASGKVLETEGWYGATHRDKHPKEQDDD